MLRFRLGGTFFPPLIFYKMFTHRPVADICSFCPRNYAIELGPTAAERNNKVPVASTSGRVMTATSSQRLKMGSMQPVPTGGSQFLLEPHLRQYTKPDGTLGFRDTFGWYAY